MSRTGCPITGCPVDHITHMLKTQLGSKFQSFIVGKTLIYPTTVLVWDNTRFTFTLVLEGVVKYPKGRGWRWWCMTWKILKRGLTWSMVGWKGGKEYKTMTKISYIWGLINEEEDNISLPETYKHRRRQSKRATLKSWFKSSGPC